MSHVATVDLLVKDLASLAAAVERCGLKLVEGQQTFRWYGAWLDDWRDPKWAAAYNGIDPKTFGTCQHAIMNPDEPNGYEIGLQAVDGGWRLVYDSWGPGTLLERKAGDKLGRLKDEYGAEVATRYYARQRKTAIREVTAEGKLRLRIRA